MNKAEDACRSCKQAEYQRPSRQSVQLQFLPSAEPFHSHPHSSSQMPGTYGRVLRAYKQEFSCLESQGQKDEQDLCQAIHQTDAQKRKAFSPLHQKLFSSALYQPKGFFPAEDEIFSQYFPLEYQDSQLQTKESTFHLL